jgi:hypothetical protein
VADRAIWALALAPRESVPLLKAQLTVTAAPQEQVAKLIADLDSEHFNVRRNASSALDQLGDAAEWAVRQALRGQPTLEVRQRLEQFLAGREKEAIRKMRAIAALEYMATSDAREVLTSLAKTAGNPKVAQAARDALMRWVR